MRKLMLFTIGFVLGCVFCAYLLSGTALLLLAVPLLIGSLIWYHQEKEVGPRKKAAMVLVGLCLGICWYQLFTQWNVGHATELDGKELEATFVASEFALDTDYGSAVDGKVTCDGSTYKARLYLNRDVSVSPGDRISGVFRFDRTASNWDSENYYFASEGICFLLYGTGKELIETPAEREWIYFPVFWRQEILNVIDELFPNDVTGFAKALLLGDTSGLSYGQDVALKNSGLRHVAAVSGLHVSILFSFLMILLGKRRVLAAILMFPAMVLFAAVSGFSPSVVRACLMQAVLHLAFLVGKEMDPATSLSFAVLVLLGVNPHSIMSAGLQLSVASTAGIMMLSRPMYDRMMAWTLWGKVENQTPKKRVISRFCSAVSVSVSASLLTVPLSAFYFGTINLLGVVSNLLVIWLITLIFCGISLTVVLRFFWILPGKFLAGVLAWGIRAVLWVADQIASLAFSTVYTESPYILIWLLLVYVLLFLYLIRKIPKLRYAVVSIALILVFAIGVSWVEPYLGEFRVSVLDVGQGQAVLIQTEGKNYLVDCGGSGNKAAADKVAAYLGSRGVFRLDGIIVTHYDKDHVGGVPYLLKRLPVERLYLPVVEDSSGWKQKILTHNRGEVCWVDRNMIIPVGEGEICLFASEIQESDNESSLCILFQKADYDILITGDRGIVGEVILLLEEQLPQLEALVVGHHGASGSTGAFLLEHLNPQTAVISVGADNPYGHPSKSVLERLEEYGCKIRRTDLEGTIVLTR